MRTLFGLTAAVTMLVFWIAHNDYVATAFACGSVGLALLVALLVGRPAPMLQSPRAAPPRIIARFFQCFSLLCCLGMFASFYLSAVHLLRFDFARAFLDLYGAVILFRIIMALGRIEEEQGWPPLFPRP